MDDDEYEIPVVYNNQQLHFKAKVLTLGLYTKKIQVDVYGTEVLFEPDDEGNYRAWIDPTNKEALEQANVYLLKEIALAIESIVND